MAFWGCEGLERVVLPDTLQEIGGSAFCGCNSLRQVSLPASFRRLSKRIELSRAGIPANIRVYR